LGIGDWAQSPIPNPQSPIPNPQFKKFELMIKNIYKIYNIKQKRKKKINLIILKMLSITYK